MKKLFKFVFLSRHSALIIYTAIVLTLAFRLYVRSGYIVKNSINEQMLHRQQIVSRVGSNHVNDLLEDWGYDLVIFGSNINEDFNNKQKLQRDLEYLISTYTQTAVVGGIIMDNKGIVIANANRSGIIDIGKDISDRDYFKWAKTSSSGTFFYGNPIQSKIGSTLGSQIITITSPIINNGKFNGAVTFAVDMRNFAQKYFDPLKITEDTRVYLMDKKGNLLYSRFPEIEGKNYFVLFDRVISPRKDTALLALRSDISDGKEGKLIVDMENQETKNLDTFLISYSPITINGIPSYVLALSTPIKQSDLFLGPIFNNQARAFVVFTFIVLGYCLIEVTIVTISSKKSYERGYRKGKE